MNEKLIEKKLRDGVKKRGGMALKFVSPGHVGVTDRIVLMPGGRIWFVETKSTGRRMTRLQEVFRDEVENLGHQHRLVDSPETLAKFLKEVDDAI